MKLKGTHTRYQFMYKMIYMCIVSFNLTSISFVVGVMVDEHHERTKVLGWFMFKKP